jgi:hypothetical protein
MARPARVTTSDLIQDVGLIGLSIVAAIFLARSGVLHDLLSSFSDAWLVGAFVMVDGNGFDGGAARLTRDLNDVKPSLRMPLLGKMRLIDVYQEFYRENSNVKKVA